MVSFGAMVGHDEAGDPFGAAQVAEAAGYDSVWVGDHVLWHAPVPDPMVTLGAMSMLCQRARLGTGVLLAPLRPATVVAKQAATVDQLSGGRLILGVGVGGENPVEYEASGVPLAERGRRLDETIEACRLLWTGERVSYEGRHIHLRDARLDYPPAQPAGPPIWIGGRSPAALRRAGRLGDGWLAFVVTPERFAESWLEIRRQAAAAGRDPDALTPALQLWCQYDEDESAARSLIAAQIERNYRVPYARFERYCIAGNADTWLRRLRAYVAAGVRQVNLIFAGGDARLQTLAVADAVLSRLIVRA